MSPSRHGALLAAVLACAIGSSHAAGVAQLDDRGTHVVLPRPAQRIVAISPHLAELAFEAGAGHKLVGTVRGRDFPPAAARLPSVGDATGLDFERITALRPDLILGWGSGNRAADLEHLAAAGHAVFVAEPRRLRDIARHLLAIGALAATLEPARRAAAAFEQRRALLEQRYAAARPRQVFIEIWRRPLFTVDERHLISDALRVCGARNAIAGLPVDAAPIPVEWLFRLDPDAIVSTLGEPVVEARAFWATFPRLKAVQRGAILTLAPERIVRATPRILDGVEELCRMLEGAQR
jgi:iron complex transport system substrate-binding protein